MTTAGTILLLCALLFMLVGMPIAYALVAGSIAALMAGGSIPLTVVPQRIFTSVASFPLMAIIFFVIAGDLMLQGGISRRLVDLDPSFLRPPARLAGHHQLRGLRLLRRYLRLRPGHRCGHRRHPLSRDVQGGPV